jgi:hypothetical protein
MNTETMTPLQQWLYAGACVLLPVVWGLVMVWTTGRIERVIARRRMRRPASEGTPPQPPTLEYHI